MKGIISPGPIYPDLINLIGCPMAKKQCPKIFKKEDCDAILQAICP
jgi:hypothetical protein